MLFDSISHLDRSATKHQVRDELLFLAGEHNQPLSKSKADRLADKFKRGEYDPDLVRVIGYSDPTGETAVNNYMRELATA